ncbi:MAG: 23S rRNA (adenine(2503)-C(2))-methyltransferase RlmN [Methanomicrobia archaeon]|nr:23S rRNA (adenine(2503)-C(2))-methyltransferase RlmN [Methanomicrobia archaeon]
MNNIYGLSHEKLLAAMVEKGQKPYRATQLFSWLYEKKAQSFDEMSDVSLSFRVVLKSEYYFAVPHIYKMQKSLDGTIKLLLELNDGSKIETALLRYNYGNALCVSSQVGCNMGCSFCASGLLKKQRNLTVDEMVGQILVTNKLLLEEGQNEIVTHIVVMGTGEPFDNYENVMDFIRIANHPKAFAIGARRITVSTCGIVPRIYDYANEGLQVNLAISLHASNDELRSKLMRINQAYPLDSLIEAVKYYVNKTGRRVTFEYILLEGVNDAVAYADELSDLIRGIEAYVNLIPYNPIDEKGYRRSDDLAVKAFQNQLTKRSITSTVRKEFGSDIDAACGQLRAKEKM